MKKQLLLLSMAAVISLSVNDAAASWSAWSEIFEIPASMGIIDIKPDSRGGWILLMQSSGAAPRTIILGRVFISSETGLPETSYFDTGIKDQEGTIYRINLNWKLFTSKTTDVFALLYEEYQSGNHKSIVRYYNLDLEQQGAPLVFDMGASVVDLRIRLDDPAGIFILNRSNGNSAKYDLSGAVVIASKQVIQLDYCTTAIRAWPTSDGGAFLEAHWNSCIACDGSYVASGACGIFPHFVKLAPDLTAVTNRTRPDVSQPGEQFRMNYAEKTDGNIFAVWDNGEFQMGGIVGLWLLTSAQKYMQKTDLSSGFVGPVTKLGDSAEGNYVFSGEFDVAPDGKLAFLNHRFGMGGPSLFVTWDPLFNHATDALTFYLYDSNGNQAEPPLEFHQPSNYFDWIAASEFDKNGRKYLVVWNENSKLNARILRENVNTPEGNGAVYSDPSGVTVTFGSVTDGGNTSITVSSSGPPTTTGFKMGRPPVYFTIDTTAVFSDGATVCIPYNEDNFSGNESRLRLLKKDATGYKDVTTSIDTENNIICGQVDSFSTFMAVEADHGAPIQSRPADESGGGCAMGGSGETPNASFVLLVLFAAIMARRFRRGSKTA